MAVNAEFLERIPLSSWSLPCTFEMTPGFLRKCQTDGWPQPGMARATPAGGLARLLCHSPKSRLPGLQGQDHVQAGWVPEVGSRGQVLSWPHCGHSSLLSLPPSLPGGWNLRNLCHPNCQVAEQPKSPGPWLTRKAAHSRYKLLRSSPTRAHPPAGRKAAATALKDPPGLPYLCPPTRLLPIGASVSTSLRSSVGNTADDFKETEQSGEQIPLGDLVFPRLPAVTLRAGSWGCCAVKRACLQETAASEAARAELINHQLPLMSRSLRAGPASASGSRPQHPT